MQPNSHDCGLYLLKNVEMFCGAALMEARGPAARIDSRAGRTVRRGHQGWRALIPQACSCTAGTTTRRWRRCGGAISSAWVRGMRCLTPLQVPLRAGTSAGEDMRGTD